jgi:serine/threonine protein kinase
MSQLTYTALGPYRLQSLLGTGGMSEVYRAFDPRLEREVAVKILSPALAGQAGFLERFRREARAAARLDHPHILPIFDFGEERGITYVVMPLIEGGTLRDRLVQRGACSLREGLTVLSQVALGLHEAHQHRLVHRDVKPANILMAPGGRALLADFGIACAIADTHDMGLTQNGMGIGTPEYMSPEQARGERVDCRADVYALGLVLFQVLTGQVPFSDEDGLAIAYKQVYEEPPHPRHLDPTIPPAVEKVILKALAKAPEDRFQTAAEFAEALDSAAPWLHLLGSAAQDSGQHPAAPKRQRKMPDTARAASRSYAQGASGAQRARDVSWGIWDEPVENDALTVPRTALRVSVAGLAPGEAPGKRPRSGRRWVALMLALVVVLLAAGAAQALKGLHLQGLAALSPPTPNAAMTSPAPSATPQPTTVYMAQFFQLTQADLMPGDTLKAMQDIPNDQYQQQEGARGMLYRGGAATQFGRAFGTGIVVDDLAGKLRFVVLVDRFDTFQHAQSYYRFQAGQLSQTVQVQVGEQGVAGLGADPEGQMHYRLLFRDRNIVITLASVKTQTPQVFQGYFLTLAQTLAQRGERCQFTLNLKPAPGAPAFCSQG